VFLFATIVPEMFKEEKLAVKEENNEFIAIKQCVKIMMDFWMLNYNLYLISSFIGDITYESVI
jgi:hypothetical protein